MIIFSHVVLAISCLIISAFNYFNPKQDKLKVSYVFASLTFITGVGLVLVNNVSILRTCVSGILFFSAVIAVNEVSRKKLLASK